MTSCPENRQQATTHGISQAVYVNWKKNYDGLRPMEMKRLEQLERENGKLRLLRLDYVDRGRGS